MIDVHVLSPERKGENMALQIAAYGIISLSEIQIVKPEYTKEYFDNNPDELKEVLYSLGVETYTLPVEEQYIQHRNRFGNIVTDWRWVGNERLDVEWCQSGHASKAAKDKASGNKILVDVYRMRGEVEVD